MQYLEVIIHLSKARTVHASLFVIAAVLSISLLSFGQSSATAAGDKSAKSELVFEWQGVFTNGSTSSMEKGERKYQEAGLFWEGTVGSVPPVGIRRITEISTEHPPIGGGIGFGVYTVFDEGDIFTSEVFGFLEGPDFEMRGAITGGTGVFAGASGSVTWDLATRRNVFAFEKPILITIQEFGFLREWGTFGDGIGEFDNPLGVGIAPDGTVYVADNANNRIQKFTATGEFISEWGSSGTGDGQFNHPRGPAVDSDGNIYIADTKNQRIQVFDSNGTFLRKWGVPGTGDGEFQAPYAVAINPAGDVYTIETRGRRVQKFTSQGDFLRKWGSDGNGDGQFNTPRGIAIDKVGQVYVADSNNSRIQKFTGDGDFLTKWGALGTGDGQFDRPFALVVSDSGLVYVPDHDAGGGITHHRIQVFNSDGAYLGKWGDFGDGEGEFNLPWGIALNSSGEIYVVDALNHRIQAFGNK